MRLKPFSSYKNTASQPKNLIFMPPDHRHAPRLYMDTGLSAGQMVNPCAEHVHYLKNVMRLKAGDDLRVFNGRDGEWHAVVAGEQKRTLDIKIAEQLKAQKAEPDLWLCCAPIKKAHFEYMVEKATELGASVIQPVLTARTQIRETNAERLRLIAIEAAEQSERLSIPEIRAAMPLKELAAQWPKERLPIVCAEWGEAIPMHEALVRPQIKAAKKAAIITGSEGGFAADELELLRKLENAVFVRLGPRILRADTAAIAALSLWQAVCGDWC